MPKMTTARLLASSAALAITVAASPVTAQTIPEPGNTPPSADTAVSPDTASQDIVVTGIRQSLSSAQNIKRNSDAIVDALVAEDIGKFPDNNASEAIARITGVQVTRYADEANGVLIRGLPNVQTTVNGREIFTADGRSVAIQDFPAQAVARVDVFKAVTAENLEGGIAGLIDVGLRRPFDFKGFQLAGAARGVYNTESRKLDPIGSLLISDRWQTGIGEIGALLNVSFTQTRFLNSVRYQGFQDNVPAAQQVLPTSVGRDFTFPQDIGLFYGRGTRQRPSVNGSLQWQPTDRLMIYADGLWQAYRNKTANDFFGIPIQSSTTGGTPPTIRNAVLTPDGTTLESFDIDLGIVNGPTKEFGRNKTDTFQGALGARWEAGNAVFTTDLAYTKSIVDNTFGQFQTQLAAPLTLSVRLNDQRSVNFVPSGVDFNDPASYYVRGLLENRQRSTGDQWQWQGNLLLDTGSSLFPKFRFGLRYANRNANSTFGDRYASLAALRDPITKVPSVADGGIIEAGFHGDDVQQFRSWYAPDAFAFNDRISDVRAYVRDALVRAGDAGAQSAWAPERPALNPLSAFRAREQVFSGYAQLDYAFDIGIPVDGVVGTRMVITRNRLDGTNSLPVAGGGTQLVPIASSTQYVDVLPNISAQLHFTDRLKLRLSRTEALTRPGFNQINPTLTIQQGTIGGNISYTGNGGNPDLQPIRSNNYDASLEYYFSRTGSVSVAGFYREIQGFINSLPQVVTVQPFGDILVYRPSNSSSGTIKGIEAAATTFFDFLPGALRGLGAQANFTYIDGEQIVPAAANFAGGRNTLPGVSKYSFNVIGLYELGPASVRLAYNYRSANVDGFGAPGVFTTVYSDAVGRLDLSASYNVNENVTLTVDATNLLRTPYHSYVKDPRYPRDVRWEASLFSAGVRFRF
ncbi:TonB-dependent receptor [Sphingomonas yunnanensis]|uniref:TonB-dependent receptor n=1 Tax=Sphingomonas yunnanensis TaxID=310400 RepID=UPI001CA758C8|nr:TonB-dependent receptor [Sphingomonas yunnanensis]MBY9064913.1 TonB-dependent receptor [Sphingomonas yunnanensis]